MKRKRHVVLAGLAAAFVSVLVAATYQFLSGRLIMAAYPPLVTAAQMRRIHIAEAVDAVKDSLKLALVLVPLTMAGVWWWDKRKKREPPSGRAG